MDFTSALTIRIPFRLDHGGKECKIHGICVQPETDNILICLPTEHTIQTLNFDRKTVASFDLEDYKSWSKDGRKIYWLNRPRGICILDSNVLVADSGNYRIKVLDAKYNFMFAFLTKTQPELVCAMDKNKF